MEWPTVLYAFAGCLGFCFIFQLRGIACCLWASLGGSLGWTVYLLFNGLPQDILRYFIATLAVAAYAEILARLTKKPAACYLVISILPLVPGGGIYYTMKYCLEGRTALFIQTGFHTLAIAGTLAIGILFVASTVRLAGMLSKNSGRPR